jgi:nucleotide-binding universal stress UspA family protein
MFKDLLLPITSTDGDEDALTAGIALAGALQARLTVLELVTVPKPSGGSWGLVPDVALAEAYRRLRAQSEVNVERLRRRLEAIEIASEVRLVETVFSAPERIAAHHAHFADLCIVCGPEAGAQGEAPRAYFASMLLESGRPVLMVPPDCKGGLPPRTVVVAWRATREAARAVHDAIPLLARAQRVDVLAVEAAGGDPGRGEVPVAEMAAHLARNGVNVNVVRHDPGSRPVGAIVLEHARESAAQMIVAGGYGHSRLREWAMGGVTRELLKSAPIPVFFSH